MRRLHGLAISAWAVVLAVAGWVAISIQPASAGETYRTGFPDDQGFFPIGVWMQSPRNAPYYAALGINTFIGLWDGPTEEQLADLAHENLLAIAAQNGVGLTSRNNRVIRAWMQQDEPDNAQAISPGVYGPCVPASEIVRRYREMKSRDPTRPVWLNFGPGLADEKWTGRGSCTGDVGYYDAASDGADILSFDIYPAGSKEPNVKGKLEYVAHGVENLRKHAARGQPVWAIIETSALDPQRPVAPEEVRSEVWMALIHGATGIGYFVHEFAPTFREDGIFRHPEVAQEVAAVNRGVHALAPILNGPDAQRQISIQSAVPIATKLKENGSELYLFAVAMLNNPAKPQFEITGIGSTRAIVLGEDRDVPVANSVFQDSFSGYGVHLYRILLGHGAERKSEQ
jgi:hypothetical protein